jgi:formylglycine-generating enzyme required for sulfatase activity
MSALTAWLAALIATSLPTGMVAIPAGSWVRGRSSSERPDEMPPHRITLHSFFLDVTLVSRGEFSRFVDVTGYRTTAEQQGYGVGASEGMNDWEWERIPHASWRRPFWEASTDTESFLRPDAPVVMVSYLDAAAYCAWQGKRLPSEAEWEYAMRAGRASSRYPWGDSPLRAPGVYGLNFWQGESHRQNLRADGYVYVSPVRAFAANRWGIYDPVGNVWQWTADRYESDTYARLALGPAADRRNPSGPAAGRDPGSSSVIKRVVRGGSWWCGACTCEGNGLHYRGKSAEDAAYNNIGFRCAADLPAEH